MQDISGKVAAVTGGASGIGRSLVKELLKAGAKVVIGDVEQSALDKVLAEFADLGEVTGTTADVSSLDSVTAFADFVYDQHGACHLLFNNAGVAAPSANVWETTPNDWAWVHGVNVMGVVYGIQVFVPRMIASGQPGHVINTSSGDGGISPLPYQSVYASSKAAVSCITECLSAQLQSEGTQLGASIFYPSGGLLDTGIWTTDRNRPEDLAREKPYDPVPTVQDFQVAAEAAGMTLEVQDLDELARYCLGGVREGRFVIMIGVEDAEATLQQRAQRIGRAELPIDQAEIPQL
ncbi:SDR family NAD(P)-dependent oxidoreductase [Halioglobus pacificus]|uniref:Dehydrogenase n=1 Tax=Parahalioglobus pacificus TaxID=930806 RepID=A0A918XH49_9GAMM|nr:SDR family NAD(P)-dependent oxidoreductase [Halioglobus pacificus]GHD31026.1 dehydrogenase [Halioglobus pacificus]